MTAFIRRHGMTIAIVVITALAGTLRYAWIITAHPWDTAADFRERYVYSDMQQYWNNADRFWQRNVERSDADVLFPPATETLIALAAGPGLERLGTWQTMQWAITMLSFACAGALAVVLFGRTAGIVALAIAAAAFPLFDYAAYMLSENMFTFALTAAMLCAALSLRREKAGYMLLAGLLFGLGAATKSIGLVAGLLLLPAASFLPKQSRLYGAGLLFAGMAAVILPVSYAMTQRNDGNFLLVSNDVLRIAMANHGDLLGVTATFPDGSDYTVLSPVGVEKGFTEMRHITVGQTDVTAENLAWIRAHPLAAIDGFASRVRDLFIGSHPFPTGGTVYRAWVGASQLLTLLLITLPAAAWLINLRSRFSPAERSTTLLLLLPLCSLLIAAAIAATEPRYLHPFLPLLIAFAAARYARWFAILKDMAARK